MHPRRTPTPAKTAATPGAGRRGWLWAIVLVACAFVAYWPALQAGFIWDDEDYVTNNRMLRDADGLRRIWFDTTATPQYYPLTHTTFWLEYRLWGSNPRGFHTVNVLLHASAAILLWRVLKRLQLRSAFLAALIFTLHPVAVESVAWITERKNVLSAVLYFAAALMYLRYVELSKPTVKQRAYYYGGALVLFVAALWSKTVVCSLPAALLLAFWWKRGRLRRGDVVPLLPFFVIGAGMALMTPWLEKYQVGAEGMDWSLTFMQRCLIAGRAVWFYAAKLIWPAQLTFIYPRWEISPHVWWQWLLPISAVGLIIGLWAMRGRIGRGPLAGVLFFVGTLFPALGFFDVYPFRYSFVADHFQYLASIGLIALAASGLSRFPRLVPVAVLLMLGLLTWRQTTIYRDLELLWRDTLAKNPACWMAHANLGRELERSGRPDEAGQHHREAALIVTNFTTCINVGNVLLREERLDEAIDSYRKAIALNPGKAEGYNNLGNALFRKGMLDEAAWQYHRALTINPALVTAINDLGLISAATGDHAQAMMLFAKAISLAPNSAQPHANLARLLQSLGQLDGAIRQYEIAVTLEPDNTGYRNALEALRAKQTR